MRQVVIKDANVFIDLERMDLLATWLQTDFEVVTSSLVMDELRRGGHDLPRGYAEMGFIESVNLSLSDFYELYEELAPAGISVADASVLHIATDRDALLLTGDGRLRAESEAKLVECHGTIWVLERLIEAESITASMAADRLQALIELTGTERRFLPRKICEERISLWRSYQ